MHTKMGGSSFRGRVGFEARIFYRLTASHRVRTGGLATCYGRDVTGGGASVVGAQSNRNASRGGKGSGRWRW